MASAREVEAVLEQLLVPDNEAIQKATASLKQIFNNPSMVPALCTVLSSATSPQVRQYAAVLLRQRVSKKRVWAALDIEVVNGLKDDILKVLIQETENPVRNSISQFIGTMASHCLSRWPQLMHFLDTYTRSQNSYERQVSMLVLKTVSAEAPEELQPHMDYLLNLCSVTLADGENPMVPYYTILILNNLTADVSGSEVKKFSALIPKILEVIQALAAHNEEQAVEVMGIFDSLVDNKVAILSPHVKHVVSFCLQIGENGSLGDALRVKALEIISWIVKMKKKAIVKLDLVQPICDIVFSIMCRADDTEDDIEDSEETDKAGSYASRIMDYLALHLPAERIVNIVMKRSDAVLKSEKACERKAGYLALGIIAEGCADHISSKLLSPFLTCIIEGFSDPHPGVRNGAMFSMGQFAEYLQPAINSYADQIIPLLLNYIKNTMTTTRNISTLTRSYYALEAIMEGLEKGAIDYLEPVMQSLLPSLHNLEKSEFSSKMMEMSLSTISAVVSAAKEQLGNYFPEIMQRLHHILSNIGEKVEEVHLQAMSTLSTLACEVGREMFAPWVGSSLAFGLALMERFNDPDVRKCVYRLLGSLASVQSEEMKPHLEKIIQLMLETLKSTEGVKAHADDDETKIFAFLEDNLEESIETDDDEDEDAVEGYSIENAYLDEKEEACMALGDIAIAYSLEFVPYVEQAYTQVQSVMVYDSADLLRTGLDTIGDFVQCVNTAVKANPSSAELNACLRNMILEVVPRYLDAVQTAPEREVATEGLRSLEDMLTNVGAPVVQAKEDFGHQIIACIRAVFKLKTACQDDDDDCSGDEEQAEQDALVIEHAGNVLPALATAMGGETFQAYLHEFIPDIEKKTKLSATVAERSFAIGVLSECLHAMGGNYATAYASRLYVLYERMLHDLDEEVRSNSIFGMGVLLSHSAGTLSDKYEKVLATLYEILKKENTDSVRDNICAAVCRIATVGFNTLPIKELYPIILECLPLREDFTENKTVYDFIADTMCSAAKPQVVERLPHLMRILNRVLPTDDIKAETKHKMLAMVKSLQQTEPEAFTTAMTCLSEQGDPWSFGAC